MESYAPGLALGSPVHDAVRRNGLHAAPEVAPWVGYADSTYRHPSGMGRLIVLADQILADSSERPRPDARIRTVSLSTADSQAAHRVEADLRARLGKPAEWCVRFEPGRARRHLYWGRDPLAMIALTVPRGSWEPAREARPGTWRWRGGPG